MNVEKEVLLPRIKRFLWDKSIIQYLCQRYGFWDKLFKNVFCAEHSHYLCGSHLGRADFRR